MHNWFSGEEMSIDELRDEIQKRVEVVERTHDMDLG